MTHTDAPVRDSEQVTEQTQTHHTAQPDSERKTTLRNYVEDAMIRYFATMDEEEPDDLYEMVIMQVEEPLLRTTLWHTRGNQTKASKMLGLNRGTLRKKLKFYDLG